MTLPDLIGELQKSVTYENGYCDIKEMILVDKSLEIHFELDELDILIIDLDFEI